MKDTFTSFAEIQTDGFQLSELQVDSKIQSLLVSQIGDDKILYLEIFSGSWDMFANDRLTYYNKLQRKFLNDIGTSIIHFKNAIEKYFSAMEVYNKEIKSIDKELKLLEYYYGYCIQNSSTIVDDFNLKCQSTEGFGDFDPIQHQSMLKETQESFEPFIKDLKVGLTELVKDLKEKYEKKNHEPPYLLGLCLPNRLPEPDYPTFLLQRSVDYERFLQTVQKSITKEYFIKKGDTEEKEYYLNPDVKNTYKAMENEYKSFSTEISTMLTSIQQPLQATRDIFNKLEDLGRRISQQQLQDQLKQFNEIMAQKAVITDIIRSKENKPN